MPVSIAIKDLSRPLCPFFLVCFSLPRVLSGRALRFALKAGQDADIKTGAIPLRKWLVHFLLRHVPFLGLVLHPRYRLLAEATAYLW